MIRKKYYGALHLIDQYHGKHQATNIMVLCTVTFIKAAELQNILVYEIINIQRIPDSRRVA